MKNLVGTVVFLLALSGLVSAQAAVEGALAHALSGGTTAAAGKALGQVENQLAGRLGRQTSNAVRPKVTNVRPGAQKSVKVPQTTATTATSPLANGGSLIASIQGGEQQETKPCPADGAGKGSPHDCGKTKTSPGQDSHPAEITLPAPHRD